MNTQMTWLPTREAALQRLAEFLPLAGNAYATQRNYDRGARDRQHVSLLSPWLRRRTITEEEVLRAVLKHHGAKAAEKFVDEVFWRAYFRGWLAHQPSVWARYRTSLAGLREQIDASPDLGQRIVQAENGRTGIDAFDHWARELVETGYLHNHARMWFASIWIFTLRLPWEAGADFFLRHLIDGDPASNTLSWRWVAGLHTRGKIYLARRDNILRFTDGRLDPGPDLAAEGLACVEDEHSSPGTLGLPLQAEMPSGNAAWLFTEEDAGPMGRELGGSPSVMPVFALETLDQLSPGRVHERVRQFACAALTCAMENAPNREGHLKGAGVKQNLAVRSDVNALAEDITGSECNQLHVYHAPFGPVAEKLKHLAIQLDQRGIQLCRHVRPYDRAAWPWASRGFFRLKKRIPKLIEALSDESR